MNPYEAEHEILVNFFSAYFHQDWRHEAETPEVVVSMYRHDTNSGTRACLQRAIVHYVDTIKDDALLEERLVSELGCYFQPRTVGKSTREWLVCVASSLSD
jgi:hypothetical protein